jgi:hypothetical protein
MINPSLILNKKPYISENLGTFIEYQPGTGKTFEIAARILDALALGIAVTVIDYGRAYYKMAQLTAGQFITMHTNVAEYFETFGDNPITVFEMENCEEPVDAELIREHLEKHPQSILVIDEIWRMEQVLPDWYSLLCTHVKAGGSFIVCYAPGDLKAYPGLPKLLETNVFICLQKNINAA